jgi:hypothetical protein
MRIPSLNFKALNSLINRYNLSFKATFIKLCICNNSKSIFRSLIRIIFDTYAMFIVSLYSRVNSYAWVTGAASVHPLLLLELTIESYYPVALW